MSEHIAVFRELASADVLRIISIIVVSWVLIRLNKYLFGLISKRFTSNQRYRILVIQPIIRLVILFSSIFLILSIIVIPTSENVFAILGATSIAIGFAFREYISSVIAGIVTLYENPYRVGDWIEFDGNYGEVIAIGLRSVKMLTSDDTIIHIPQIKLWENSIHNANAGSQNLMCVVNYYIANHENVIQVKDILHDVAISCPYVQLDNRIDLLAKEHPHYTQIRLKAYPIEPRDQFKLMSDLTSRGKEALKKQNISFPKYHPSNES